MKWKIKSHLSSFSNIDIMEVLIPLESTVKVSDIIVTGKAALAGIKKGDFIDSIKIGEKTYSLGNAYEFNDVLINVLVSTSEIKLGITTTNDQGEEIQKEITINLSASDFVEIL